MALDTMWIRKRNDLERASTEMATQGHLQINVAKALQFVAERKRNATSVRERVLSDLNAVFGKTDMTFREFIECAFAMADSDEAVAMHAGNIKLSEVLGTNDDKPKARRSANKERVQKAKDAILELLKEHKTPMLATEIKASLPQFDELHFRSAWAGVRELLKKSGEGRNMTWQIKKKI